MLHCIASSVFGSMKLSILLIFVPFSPGIVQRFPHSGRAASSSIACRFRHTYADAQASGSEGASPSQS